MIPTYQVPYYVGGPYRNTSVSENTGKIIVLGLPNDATQDVLTEYFSQYGTVAEVKITIDEFRNRNFAYVTFVDISSASKVLADQRHVIIGKPVEIKRAQFQVPYYVGGSSPVSDDAGKIFIGGLPADATKDDLADYFTKYGAVSECIIMNDNITGRSRGFGFLTFVDSSTVNEVLAAGKHVINGKAVDAKRAVPKGPNQGMILKAMGITPNRADRNPDCKVFVGGVAQGTTESDLETYFKEFGNVLEVKIPKDQNTQRARGFSFVLFDNANSVHAATQERFHRINGKTVEVKTVEVHPKSTHSGNNEASQGEGSPYMMGQRSGYYPGYSGFLASLESSGYGGLSSTNMRPQGLENYSYMAPLYHGMAELSMGQRYGHSLKGYPMGYQISGNSQMRAPQPTQTGSYSEYPASSYNPTFAALSNVNPQGGSALPFPMTGSQQSGSNQSFPR